MRPDDTTPLSNPDQMDGYAKIIAQIRDDLADKILLASAVLGLPALLTSLARAAWIGWRPAMSVQIALYLLLLVAALLRKRLALGLRAAILAGVAFLAGIFSLITWGLLSTGPLLLLAACLLAIAFGDRRSGVVLILASVATLSLIALGILSGIVQPGYDVQAYALAPGAWIAVIFTFILVASALAVVLILLLESQVAFVHNLGNRSADLLNANQRLRQEIIERQRAEAALQRQNEYLAALQDTTLGLVSRLDLDSLLESIVKRAGQLLGSTHGFLDLVEPGKTDLEPKVALGALGESIYHKVNPGEGLAGKIWQSGQPLAIDDYDTWSGRVDAFSRATIRSVIGVPLISNSRVIGVLGLAHDITSRQTFDQEDAEILRQFAQLAAIALDNAWLFTETRQLLWREQRLKEIVRTLGSSLELSEILPSFMRLAVQLVGAQAGSLGLLSPDQQTILYPYYHNVPDKFDLQPILKGTGLDWKVVESGEPILLADYCAHPDALPELITRGVGSYLGVPVTAGKERIGVLGLITTDPEERFTESQLSLAQVAGQQAALAIQNARRFEIERARRQRQAALFRLSARLAATLKENEIWQQVTEGLYEPPLGYTHISALELDLGTNERMIRGCVGWARDWLGRRLPPGQGLSERPLLDGQLHYSPDITLEPDYLPGLGSGCEVDLPIRIEGELVGVLVIENADTHIFGQEDFEVFTAAANQAGLALGQARLFRSTQQHLAEIEALQALLREQAIRDPLTGLFNRRYMQETLHREIARAKRDGSPISIMIMDVDHFKSINDTHGHQAGDYMLQSLSELLKQHIRTGDIVCRYGGEEFLVIMPGASLPASRKRAEQLRADIEALSVPYAGKQLKVTLSIGLASFPLHGTSDEDTLIKADRALYHAKQAGRNRVEVYSPPDGQSAIL